MPAQSSSDIFGLLFITLFFAHLWWTVRLHEIIYEGNSDDRLPGWMRFVGQLWGMAKEPPKKTERWLLGGLFLVIHMGYLIPFYPHITPFLSRLLLVIVCFAIFGVCVYYCEKKMGQ